MQNKKLSSNPKDTADCKAQVVNKHSYSTNLPAELQGVTFKIKPCKFGAF